MSFDEYPRVRTSVLEPNCWYREDVAAVAQYKVVPAAAIVIEPQDFSDEQAQSIAGNALGYVPRSPEEIARLHEHVIYLASALARLQAHPPVDEAQVEALSAELETFGLVWDTNQQRDALARRLVAQGWKKEGPK